MDIETVAELEVEVSEIGEKGYSAYEVAVQNGFVGTETEWLASLKGADGINGHDGRDGQDGENGTNGQDGITPTIGDNGNWYLGETDTGKPSRGIQGIQGVAGQDGNDGEDGISPTVSTSKVGKVTTISITDKNGVHTATINDGEDGQDGVTMAQVEAITGDLANLDTTDKTDLVSAINEVLNSGNGIVDISDVSEMTVKTYPIGIYYSNKLGYLKIYARENKSGAYANIETSAGAFIFVLSDNNNQIANVIAFNRDMLYYINGNNYFKYEVEILNIFNNILFKNNTTSYTPTANYHPATKKYVDDSIASAITTTLGGGY